MNRRYLRQATPAEPRSGRGAGKPGHWGLVTSLLLAIATPAFAGEADGRPIVGKWEIQMGSIFSSISNTLRLDAKDQDQGTSINFQKDLDFNDSETLLNPSVSWRFARKHQLTFSYSELSQNAATTLTKEIEWGDEVFPIDVTVRGFLDTSFLGVRYTYWPFQKERWAAGFTFGLQDISLDTGIGLKVEGIEIGPIDKDAQTDVPVPQLGAELRWELVKRLVLVAKVNYIKVNNLGDYSGSLLDGTVALEYRAWKNFGIGLGFSTFDLDVEVTRSLFLGKIEYDVDGGYLYGRVAF